MKSSVGIGGIIYCALAAGTFLGRFNPTTIELLFFLAPLVIVPLGLDLTARLDRDGPPPIERVARVAQLPAALFAVASFWFSSGPLAAGFATVWLLWCALLGVCGSLRLRRGFSRLDTVGAALALIYLPVGGAWLVASRAGMTPLGFEEPIVLLTAVHFHYAGFAAPLLARAAGQALAGRGLFTKAVFPSVAAGVLVGPALLAAAFVTGPFVKLLAALLLAASQVGLAFCFLAALRTVKPRLAKTLLVISSASLAFGMVLASVWALGEYPRQPFVNLAQMARLHGAANAFGFTLCGLIGWTLASRATEGD